MAEIQVVTGGGGYRVHIGQGVIERDLARDISRMSPGGVTVVSHPSIYAKHGRRLQDALEAALKHREDISLYLFPEGEENKCLKNLEKGYRAMLKTGVTREHILVCFGGGVVGDLAGFLAATYMRGMRYVQAPTTLMAMVDSAIGGKVGVDLPGAKNAVGAFYQPQGVYSDIDLLDTLPERELRSGLMEVVKYGFLFDEKLLESVEAWGGGIPARGRDLGEIIDTCVAYKARVVSADERDLSGERALLNYGHTFGHALESSCGYGEMRHGEAVALGMIMAARLSEIVGLSGEGLYAYHCRVLLPILSELPDGCHLELGRIMSDMQTDKKKGERMRFVLLEEPQSPHLVESVVERSIVSAVEETLEMLRRADICH